ncbi:hypothetical protein niasHT_024869 [Heterodera trifolii]|uniref:Ubiquitin-like domain-containing protein n=1 Tax=Heterodera trifolii TaxID=157864 RepID=A0ABD2JGJ4_9BILA
MSRFGFSLFPVGVSVGIIIMLMLMIPSFNEGMKITVKSGKNIPKNGGAKTDILSKLKKQIRASSSSKNERTSIIIDLNREQNVAALKQAIEKKTGIPPQQQQLRLNSSSGDVLKDGETLKNGGNENAELFMSFGELEILVKYGTESFAIRVDKSDTVATLKQAIKERFGIPNEKQKLRRSNHPTDDNNILEDAKTMDNYQILNGAAILLSFILTLNVETHEPEITVEDKMNGNVFSVEVEGTESVATLRRTIINKLKKDIGLDIRSKPQKLRLNNTFGLALEDDQTMDFYEIKDGQTILLSFGEFQINVQYGMKIVAVGVKGTDTVATLKRRIENIEQFGNISTEKQALRRSNRADDNILENSKTMNDYQIVNGATIFLFFIFTLKIESHERIMNIFMENIKDKVLTVELEGTESVAKLKNKIMNKIKKVAQHNIPTKAQTLRLNNTFGLALEDDQTMEFYKIKDGQTILLSLCEFQISVNYGMETLSVDVKGTDTVATLKRRIENIKQFGNIPPKKQILRRLGGSVYNNDSETMEYYYVRKDATVIVTWNEFEISVKYDEIKEPFTVKVKYDDTVKSLKDKIEEKFRIPPEKQKLSHSRAENLSESKEILYDNSFPICNYYIVKGETIFVSDAFQITVEYTLNDQKAINKVEVKGKDTVKNVKEKIKAMIEKERNVKLKDEGANMELKKSVDKILDQENKTMDAYGIKEGDTIYGNCFKHSKMRRKQASNPPNVPRSVGDAESGTLPSVVRMFGWSYVMSH